MLVLSQNGDADENVIIRDPSGQVVCEVILVSSHRQKVKIGYVSDRSYSLNRRAVDARIQQEGFHKKRGS